MKKRSSVIAYTLAAVLALSNLSPAAVYAAETEAANAAAAATEEISAEEEASSAEALATQENEEEEASPAGTTDAGSEEVSAPEEAVEEATAEEATAEEAAALKDEELADDEEVDADAAIEADTSAENTDSEDEAAAEAESEEETEIAENEEESTPADPVEKVTEDPAEANKPVSDQPTPEQPVVEPADAIEIIYSDGITEGSGREAKAAGKGEPRGGAPFVLQVKTDLVDVHAGCRIAFTVITVSDGDNLGSGFGKEVIQAAVAVVTGTFPHVGIVGHLMLVVGTGSDLVRTEEISDVILDVESLAVDTVVPGEELISC